MTLDVEALALAAFDAWADGKSYSIDYRRPYRRAFVAAYLVGFQAGTELAKVKRRSKPGG